MAETDGVVLCAVQDMLLHPEVVESALAHAEKALAPDRRGLHAGWIAVGSDTKCGVPSGIREYLPPGFTRDLVLGPTRGVGRPACCLSPKVNQASWRRVAFNATVAGVITGRTNTDKGQRHEHGWYQPARTSHARGHRPPQRNHRSLKTSC